MKETSKQILIEVGTALLTIVVNLCQKTSDKRKKKKGDQ